MGMPGFRRARAAKRSVRLFCMILLLHSLTAWTAAALAADPEPNPDPNPKPAVTDTGPDSRQAVADAGPDPAASPVHSVGSVTATATGGERDVLEVPGHVTVIDR